MRIGDLKLKRHVIFSFLFLVLGAGVYGQNATLASSTANANCAICVPNLWVKGPGTPDMSSGTTAATSATSGGGATWNPSLPAPANNLRIG